MAMNKQIYDLRMTIEVPALDDGAQIQLDRVNRISQIANQ